VADVKRFAPHGIADLALLRQRLFARNMNSPPTKESAMRALAAKTVPLVVQSLFTSDLLAQQKVSAFNGVWHRVEVRVVSPDSTYMRPPSTAVSILLDGHFSNFAIGSGPPGVQQAARPTTVEEKAARYDVLTANAGTFEVHDSTIAGRYEYAKNPATVGTTFSQYFRLVGDTLWNTTVTPWATDTTKRVRTTIKWVRQK
jgi:hypothetical protein